MGLYVALVLLGKVFHLVLLLLFGQLHSVVVGCMVAGCYTPEVVVAFVHKDLLVG